MAGHSHKFTIADDNKDSNQKVRQAFFHGLLTGYAVALKLW
jgi:hypothetical protein